MGMRRAPSPPASCRGSVRRGVIGVTGQSYRSRFHSRLRWSSASRSAWSEPETAVVGWSSPTRPSPAGPASWGWDRSGLCGTSPTADPSNTAAATAAAARAADPWCSSRRPGRPSGLLPAAPCAREGGAPPAEGGSAGPGSGQAAGADGAGPVDGCFVPRRRSRAAGRRRTESLARWDPRSVAPGASLPWPSVFHTCFKQLTRKHAAECAERQADRLVGDIRRLHGYPLPRRRSSHAATATLPATISTVRLARAAWAPC